MFDTPIDKKPEQSPAWEAAMSRPPPVSRAWQESASRPKPESEAWKKAFGAQMEEYAANVARIVQKSMQAIQSEASATQQAFVDTIARVVAETRLEKEQMKYAQGNVMHGHPPFSLRVNLNDKKLQWIARESAINPDTGVEWSDELWSDVQNGDFVEVTL
jgi:hypothetical protein